MRNWKTSLFGIITIAVYILGYLFPEHKQFLDGVIPVAVGGGLLAAKDHNVTGGTIQQ
jgi:hypothetical protein